MTILVTTRDGKYKVNLPEGQDLHSLISKFQGNGYYWISDTQVIPYSAVTSLQIVASSTK